MVFMPKPHHLYTYHKGDIECDVQHILKLHIQSAVKFANKSHISHILNHSLMNQLL